MAFCNSLISPRHDLEEEVSVEIIMVLQIMMGFCNSLLLLMLLYSTQGRAG